MNEKKKIALLVFNRLAGDSRVQRQARALATHYAVTVFAFDTFSMEGIAVQSLEPIRFTLFRKLCAAFFLLTRRYGLAYSFLYGVKIATEKMTSFDLYIANDVDTLPLAFRVARGKPVWLDAHEYAPRQFENSASWKFFFQPFNTFLCRNYIPKTAGMSSVSQGLVDEYARQFGASPVLITNASPYVEVAPRILTSNAIRLLYHGAINVGRQLHVLVDMMKWLPDNVTLDFMLVHHPNASKKTKAYSNQFIEEAKKDTRIRFPNAVPVHELNQTLQAYDVGVLNFPPVTFNLQHTLPNKFFELIQARVAIVCGPTPEIAHWVRHFGIGEVSDDFTAEKLAQKILSLTTEKINQYKLNTRQAAKELCAEKNEHLFLQHIEKILQG